MVGVVVGIAVAVVIAGAAAEGAGGATATVAALDVDEVDAGGSVRQAKRTSGTAKIEIEFFMRDTL